MNLVVILLIVLLLFGGGGYGLHAGWPGYAMGPLGLVLLIVVLFLLFNAVR